MTCAGLNPLATQHPELNAANAGVDLVMRTGSVNQILVGDEPADAVTDMLGGTSRVDQPAP